MYKRQIEISVTEYEPLKKISARGKRITALPIESFEQVASVTDETEDEEEELTDE